MHPNPIDIGLPARFATTHYLLFDGERGSYHLETEILPPQDQRWIIMHQIDLEVRHGVYELGKFLHVLQLHPVYRHLSTEAYQRWLSHHTQHIPWLAAPSWTRIR